MVRYKEEQQLYSSDEGVNPMENVHKYESELINKNPMGYSQGFQLIKEEDTNQSEGDMLGGSKKRRKRIIKLNQSKSQIAINQKSVKHKSNDVLADYYRQSKALNRNSLISQQDSQTTDYSRASVRANRMACIFNNRPSMNNSYNQNRV